MTGHRRSSQNGTAPREPNVSGQRTPDRGTPENQLPPPAASTTTAERPAARSESQFSIGPRASLPGHFSEPVVLEAVRRIGSGFECRVRLPNGAPDETSLSLDEAAALLGQRVDAVAKIQPADPEKLRLLVEAARIRLA